MATAHNVTRSPKVAPRNHRTRVGLVSNVAPRSRAAPIRAITCSEPITTATDKLPNTIRLRGIGAASRSRCPPLSLSTINPTPPSTQLSGGSVRKKSGSGLQPINQ